MVAFFVLLEKNQKNYFLPENMTILGVYPSFGPTKVTRYDGHDILVFYLVSWSGNCGVVSLLYG